MLPPFLLPSSLHAPPLPLPGAPLWRLGSAAAAAAAASPAGCSLALPRTQPAPSKHSAASCFRLRGGGKREGKRFKLQIQPTKQGRPDVSSSTGPENQNACWRLLIRFFIAAKNTVIPLRGRGRTFSDRPSAQHHKAGTTFHTGNNIRNCSPEPHKR